MDYWDRLGWRDPFGAAAYSTLQKQYAKQFGAKGLYTPMLVVNGKRHTSSSAEATRWIGEHAAKAPAVPVALEGRVTPEGSAELSVRVERGEAETGALALQAVAWENDLTTKITAGELKGETVTEWAVVRSVSPRATPDKDGRATVTVPIAADWKLPNTGFLVIARDPATMEIRGAATILHSQLKPSGR